MSPVLHDVPLSVLFMSTIKKNKFKEKNKLDKQEEILLVLTFQNLENDVTSHWNLRYCLASEGLKTKKVKKQHIRET